MEMVAVKMSSVVLEVASDGGDSHEGEERNRDGGGGDPWPSTAWVKPPGMELSPEVHSYG